MILRTTLLALATLPATALAPARAPRALEVAVLGTPDDSRLAAVEEAVAFWNGELESVGAGVRLGPVRVVDDAIPDDVLRGMSRSVLVGRGSRLPDEAETVSGQIVIALSHADLVSFAIPWSRWNKGFVALRRADVPPLSLPNVARNATAHELGHVLGLPHNSDPSTLMCGRPAPCRPGLASETDRFFPLTPEDERELRDNWP
jgi:hypothetical protein